ncbi:unnamed protein product [Bursaphelenchus xylophilus]|uniref:(pine wood nematode) hypothetical protein n=1 Tax=Bursaphelenchus xylophilus TaxID=6326 RepID=A0A1I7SX47_BURXY|nr:unnamed protein product [Bursaphelenchus xylophilus]CAG9100168.1 unnamed protein product [Bursaphelenchus xylophilus]
MEKFLFDKVGYDAMYNCTLFPTEQWHKFGYPNKIIGTIYMFIGVTYEVLYFPCLCVMSTNKFLKLSCYKIMFFLGIIDMACISINSIMAGYFAWHGTVFCDYPVTMYVSGAISTGLWCAACMTCMILAMNRCCDLLKSEWMEYFFQGWKTYAWLLAPTLYGSYFAIFTPPVIFTSIYDGAFFDPFVGMPVSDKEKYTSIPHTVNNVTVIIVLCISYTSICIYVCMKTHSISGNSGMNTLQKQLIAQATLICLLIFAASSVYVLMQFVELSGYMVILGQISWQSSHGGTVFIYLFLNKTMRTEIRATFLPRFLQKNRHQTFVTDVGIGTNPQKSTSKSTGNSAFMI